MDEYRSCAHDNLDITWNIRSTEWHKYGEKHKGQNAGPHRAMAAMNDMAQGKSIYDSYIINQGLELLVLIKFLLTAIEKNLGLNWKFPTTDIPSLIAFIQSKATNYLCKLHILLHSHITNTKIPLQMDYKCNEHEIMGNTYIHT